MRHYNQDHATGGIAGVSVTAMIATVLQHFQGIDAATAAAEAGLLTLLLGALYGAGVALLNRFAPKETKP